MSEMVERVARAICVARGGNPDRVLTMNNAFDDGRPESSMAMPAWNNHVAAARAAIEALRDNIPEGIVLAGHTALLEWDARTGDDLGIMNMWEAMLDAALFPPL